jgi:thiol-disulfide isomerase/thioredoxin
MMLSQAGWSGILLLSWMVGAEPAGELGVGDPAPKLAVGGFLKGDPVKEFEEGKVYVVEFWATWCGPCRVSIPHLTELQNKHPDVVFVGISVYEHDPKAVAPFVESMHDKMGYRVATDTVPDGAKPEEGKMAKTWLDAAAQDGIPTAFVIDRHGTIAWIGHPMELQKPLDAIVAGSWNLAEATARFKEEMKEKRELRALMAKLSKARASGDTKTLLIALDEGIATQPKFESQLGVMKFRVMASETGYRDKALKYGKRLVNDVLKDNARFLNVLAWGIVNPKAASKPESDFVKLAIHAAERADELTGGKEPTIIDTLARGYFASGDVARAIQTQERAIKEAKGTAMENDDGLNAALEEYRKVAAKDQAGK